MVLRKSFYIRWSAGRSPRDHEVNPGRDPSWMISILLPNPNRHGTLNVLVIFLQVDLQFGFLFFNVLLSYKTLFLQCCHVTSISSNSLFHHFDKIGGLFGSQIVRRLLDHLQQSSKFYSIQSQNLAPQSYFLRFG